MPIVRKISPDEAAQWDKQKQPARRVASTILTPEEAEALLAALPDRRGINRMDRYGKSTYGWLARVYGAGRKTFSKLFSDSRYGSAASALAAAVAWRDETRQAMPAEQPHPALPYIERVDDPARRLAGYYAYRSRRQRRYFSDRIYNGRQRAKAAAQQWIA
jgi:hypothetical protein